MQLVPLSAVPAQNFAIVLGGQQVAIDLYLLGAGAARALYMDLTSGGESIFTARIARAYAALPGLSPRWMLAGRHYLGFLGDLIFIDTQATANAAPEDPQPAGLGARWQLLYVTDADLEAAGLTP